MELFKLKRGNIETTHKDEIELIHGVEFLKPELKEYGKDIVRYLYTMTSKYFLTHRPLDKLSEPHMALTLSEPEHTILRPELTTILNGQTFPGWVVEVASPQNAEIAYLLKTNLYATAGVKEYWIIDPDKKIIMVYQFEKQGLIPNIYKIPQRIKVSVYKDYYLSYSEIFKERVDEA